MKNRGFTLIEVLAVIVILSILSLITIPIIDSSLNKGKEGLAEAQKQQLIKGLKDYYAENIKELNGIPNNGSGCKTVKQLKDSGYLPADIKDPKTNQNISDTKQVCVKKSGNKLTYSIK